MAYIYEQSSWPNFQWDERSIGATLAAVRHRQGRLLGRMDALGFSLRAQASFRMLTQDVIKTSEIEGEILNKDQVRSSLARRLGMDVGALIPSDRYVDGVVEMMLDATEKFAAPLTQARLFRWHAALFPTGHSGMFKISVAAYRNDKSGPMQVVSGPLGRQRVHFEAPPARRIKTDMDAFLRWFNGPQPADLVLKAGIAHLWFVTIHPFADGNGRIARALTDLMLARSESSPHRFYSMSAQIQKEREDYYRILESAQKDSLDITAWLDWFLGCLSRAFDSAEVILSSVLAKNSFWEKHAGESFNDRQRKVLNRLLDGFEGKLTSSKYAKLAKTSPDTALRDINDLLQRRVLINSPGGGRSTSYALPDKGFASPEDSPEPFLSSDV